MRSGTRTSIRNYLVIIGAACALTLSEVKLKLMTRRDFELRAAVLKACEIDADFKQGRIGDARV